MPESAKHRLYIKTLGCQMNEYDSRQMVQLMTRGRDFEQVENAEDAQDLTQEAFLRTYQKLPDFKRGSQFYTWLLWASTLMASL